MNREQMVGLLAQTGRARRQETGDDGAATFAMVRAVNQYALPEGVLTEAVAQLRTEGVLAPAEAA